MFRKVELELGLGTLPIDKNHDNVLSLSLRASCFVPSPALAMWARLSNALKHRPTVDETESSSSDVLPTVPEKHTDLSEPRNNDDGENRPAEVPFPVPSPPASPSRHRNGVFRRMSRSAKHDSGEPSKASSAIKLPLRLPKKVKSHISLQMNSRYISLRPCPMFIEAVIMTSVSSFHQYCSRFRKTSTDRCHKTVN